MTNPIKQNPAVHGGSIKPRLESYASGSGALSFSYTEGEGNDRKSVGHPTTIAEVALSRCWLTMQENIKNFDYVLQDFGSEQYPQILAFGPVRRLGPDRLRTYAYGKVSDVRYEKIDDCDRWRYFFRPEHAPETEHELVNWSMRGVLNFFLDHEQKCTEALELRDLRERTAGKPHLVPLP